MEYVIVIERGDDGSVSADVPDLPGCVSGCVSCCDTLDELRINIRAAIGIPIESLREHGEPVPPQSATTETVMAA